MDATIADHEIHIDGYKIVRLDRNRHGGGVCIYIKSDTGYIVRSDLAEKSLEVSCKPFLISTWYTPNTPVKLFNDFEKVVA